MNTQKNLIILLFSALALTARAADPPKSAPAVAVYDFAGEAEMAGYASKVTVLLTAKLTTESNLVLVERGKLTRALKEQALGISGMVSSEAAAKIGQITGAKILVAGQVMKIGDNHLVVVADIIGTETGRLFAGKVEGAPDNLMDLTSELSRKIARIINDHASDLTAASQETSAEHLDRIIKGIAGTNRPSVSVRVQWGQTWGKKQLHNSDTINGEFGNILLKAGFTVVDANSDRKPDIEITGIETSSEGPRQGDLFSFTETMDLKVQERRTGNIIAIEHQTASATGRVTTAVIADAQVNAVDTVAERILPLLAK